MPQREQEKFKKAQIMTHCPQNGNQKLFTQRACFLYVFPIPVHQEQQDTIEHYDSEDAIETQMCLQADLQNEAIVQWAEFVKVKKNNYLKQYQLIKKLGAGGFGVVYKVKSRQMDEIRAAKIIDKFDLSNSEKEELNNELAIMKKIDHPHIVKLFEVYDNSQQFVLIMEHCVGKDLYGRAKQRRLKQFKAKKIIRQLLKAVCYIHSRGIIHRDIKPQNILFEDQQRTTIKLIDFGISTFFKQGEFFSAKTGTPSYMAPQIIQQKYNQKCDIWAVGITMYFFISGNFPFISSTLEDVYHRILYKQPAFHSNAWKEISEDCKDIIKLMLTKNPLQRLSAKQLLEHPYFNIKKVGIKKRTKSRQSKVQSITKNLRTFKFQSRLQAILQTFIASQILTLSEKQILKELFQQFDTNKDGTICAFQLRNGLGKIKNISLQRIQILMAAIDTNGSGQIDYTQFLAAGFTLQVKVKREKLKQVFKYFDNDKNGKISYEEVVQFLSNYQQSEQEILKTFKAFDANGDGCISQDQFIQLLLKNISSIDSQKLSKKCKLYALHQKTLEPVKRQTNKQL